MTETIEWIACADRLPEPAQVVLAAYLLDGERRVCAAMWDEYHNPLQWADPDAWALDFSSCVTHWAAWPGGPKE